MDSSAKKPNLPTLPFVELHCLSNYSFLRAASHPEELIDTAIELGYRGLAITDECSVAGIVKAWQRLLHHQANNPLTKNFKFIVGAEFHFDGDLFVVIATCKKSYGELCTLITHCRRSAEKGTYNFTPDDLTQFIQTGKILWKPGSRQHKDYTDIFHKNNNRIYLLLEFNLTHNDELHERAIYHWSKELNIPIVASNGAVMHSNERKELLDTLFAINNNSCIEQLANKIDFNAEHYLRPIEKLLSIYPQEYLTQSNNIANECKFCLHEIAYQYPTLALPKGQQASSYLRELTYKGAHVRYPEGIPDSVMQQIEKELLIIGELKYEFYFLTIYDIVNFARRQKILCQGRGSAANSVVCYCLFITDVDPTRVSLLFERFISKSRNDPPDIDVDFDNSRREEVIQYVYSRYGRQHSALAATVISYRRKSAVRDVGKALGFKLDQLERVIANYGWRYRHENWLDEIITPALTGDARLLENFKKLVAQILGFPRHLSQHVGGFVITKTKLSEIVPIENAAMPDRTIIQWDKTDLEAMGLMKVDILALGMLSAMDKAFHYISKKLGKSFSLGNIPRVDDPDVFNMLQKADSIGLFQVESRAQMNMLPRLKPACFYDLVVQVAIVRPGPIQGDMVHPYLKRKQGKEAIDIPLECLQPVLQRTYGVPIFQEQVIALAMHGADFSAAEAEELRRSMATWKSQGHMHTLRQKLTARLLAKGLSSDYVQRICRQIEGFGEYGFPESHAASFAWLAYVSAWLKYYYPEEFLCALLNSQPMGFYQPWQLIQDAQRHGVAVLPADINKSNWQHQVVKHDAKDAVRLGFCSIYPLREEPINTLLQLRPKTGFLYFDQLPKDGKFKSTIEALACANALTSLTEANHTNKTAHRFQAQWLVGIAHRKNYLFASQLIHYASLREPSRTEHLLLDHDTTGFSLDDHPMAIIRSHNELKYCQTAKDLEQLINQREYFVAGVVINRQRPKTSAGVTFLTLEDETGTINIIVWLKTAHNQLKELTQARILKVFGKLERDESSGVIHLIAYKLLDISSLLSALDSRSRDFH